MLEFQTLAQTGGMAILCLYFGVKVEYADSKSSKMKIHIKLMVGSRPLGGQLQPR
jgi:hypothetical protein